jgi:hypothetical protein
MNLVLCAIQPGGQVGLAHILGSQNSREASIAFCPFCVDTIPAFVIKAVAGGAKPGGCATDRCIYCLGFPKRLNELSRSNSAILNWRAPTRNFYNWMK